LGCREYGRHHDIDTRGPKQVGRRGQRRARRDHVIQEYDRSPAEVPQAARA
jgi:hypothetical protein